SMAFTVDETVGAAFNSTLNDIQINLSTTTMTADNLSATFADNVGADETIVLNRGSLDLSSAGANGTFDIVVHFDTPFFYDPALGNLLLDVRNFGAGFTTQFDAHDVVGDSISREFAGDVFGTVGGTVLSLCVQRQPLFPMDDN
ncbi:MAG: hypothetical protein IH937_15290, partial [Acidobacteria bacterium]|nr:hypothetical protein [Acidobacteriota bacterium]